MTPKRKFLIIAIVVIAALMMLGVSTFLSVTRYRLRVASRAADAAFLASRGGGGTVDPDSFAFLSRGVRAGMDRNAVDAVLAAGAAERVVPVVEQNLGSRLYRFNYGKPFHDPFTGEDEALMSDQYIVYFDADGLAYRILYLRVGRGAYRQRSMELDLGGEQVMQRSGSRR